MINTELLEKKDLREQLIGRIDILSKVKELFLIPKMEVLTVKQVAEYFEVPVDTIQGCYKDNKNEINADGVILKPYKDFSTVGFPQLNISKGKATFQVTENITLEIPTRGIKVFPQRAILRIAMLLRDSEVAKEVRTQLLNTFEQSTSKQRTADIDEETGIMLEIGRATMSGEIERITMAYTNAFAFKNRHITKLEENNTELSQNNKALAGEIFEWNDRSKLNKAIRLIASARGTKFGYIWKELYDELLYKHHIGLQMRGESPYIQHIKEKEWKFVLQSVSAICENSGISQSKIFEKAKLN